MTPTESVLEKLIYQVNGFVYMKLCLDITFYWSGGLFDRCDGVLKFYEEALEVLGKSVRYFRTETMTEARSIQKGTLDLVPFWLQGTKSRRDIYMLFLESGPLSDETSDRAFALNATPAKGYVRLVLPTSTISGSVTPYLDLARNMGRTVSYDFGQAGYATNWNQLGRNKKGVFRAMNSLAHRYPGLDISYPLCTKYIAPKGIKCVNWLTFLNEDCCNRLGGVPALANKFDSSVVFHQAKNGVMIQAGPSPEIGDVNRQKNLPVYHQVGKELAPIRYREHPPLFGPDGFPDKETTEKWLSRFDS